MTTILIPTDFSENSLHMLQDLLKSFNNGKVRIIFFHAFKLTDGITDLLMLSRRTAEYGQIPTAFHQACDEFRQQNKTIIDTVRIAYFYGSTIAAFRNFAEANEIDAIFYPEQYLFRKISKYSLDPAVLLKKSGISMMRSIQKPVSVIEEVIVPEIQEHMTEMV